MPTSGDFRKGRTLRIGRYAQHFVDALQMDETPVEYLQNKYPSVRRCHLLSFCAGLTAECLQLLLLLCIPLLQGACWFAQACCWSAGQACRQYASF